MTHSESASTEELNRRSLIEQFAYFADEIRAQTHLVVLIPDTVLGGRVYDGALSIYDRYRQLLERERKIHSKLAEVLLRVEPAGGHHAELPSDATIQEVLSLIAEIRFDSAERVASMNVDDWARELAEDSGGVSLSAWLYATTLGDADMLKEIGEQFFEQQLTFTRGQDKQES